MPIVRKPLMQRLANAAMRGMQIYRGRQLEDERRERAGTIRSILESADDPTVSMLAGFVDPETGEIGKLGESLLGMELSSRAGASKLQQQLLRDKAREEARIDRIYLQEQIRDKNEQTREKRRGVRDILEDLEDVTTLGAGGKIKSLKPGLLRTQYGINPATLGAADKRRMAEMLYEGVTLPREAITPGQKAKPPLEIGPFQFGGQEFQPTTIDYGLIGR